MNENLKPCPFCGGEVEVNPFANPEYYFVIDCKSCKVHISYISQNGFDKNRTVKENAKINKQATINSWNTRAANTLVFPARVGDFIVVKDGDSTETLRIDGFELKGDDLMIWGEGENERYVAFGPDEIIKYVPREDKHEKRSN